MAKEPLPNDDASISMLPTEDHGCIRRVHESALTCISKEHSAAESGCSFWVALEHIAFALKTLVPAVVQQVVVVYIKGPFSTRFLAVNDKKKPWPL